MLDVLEQTLIFPRQCLPVTGTNYNQLSSELVASFLRFHLLLSREGTVSSILLPFHTGSVFVSVKAFVSYDCISTRSNIKLNFELAKYARKLVPDNESYLKVAPVSPKREAILHFSLC